MRRASRRSSGGVRKFSKYFFLSFLFLGVLTTSLVVKLSTANKPAFYNFESYIHPENKKCLNQHYNYSVFQNISEFKSLLQQSKTIGGVTSDFQVVSLINEGLVKPINFSLIYKEFPSNSPLSKQEEFLQSIWREQVWEHFESFNKYLRNNDRYWRYVLPYYMQDKVVAYNVDKLSRKNLKLLTEEEQENGITFPDKSLFGIVKTLSEKGFKKIAWNNSPQDNLLHGAYYYNQKHLAKTSSTPFYKLPTLVTEANLKRYVESFLELVEDSTGAPLSDTSRNLLISDGLEIVTRLIDPNGDLDAALLYNGDALDAYYYEDNFPSLEERQPPYLPVKFIRPVDNVVFVDVLVVNSNLSLEESDRLLKEVNRCVYQGVDLPETEIISLQEEAATAGGDSLEQTASRSFFSQPQTLPWLRNFDYINYTPTHKNFYNFFFKHYFLSEEGEVDEVAREMYQVHKSNGQHTFTAVQPLDEQLSSLLNIEYFLKTHS